MVIDTSNLTGEQINKLVEIFHKMEEENTKPTKWWIMQKYTILSNEIEYAKYGPCYQVEPQGDVYSKNKPPLKSGFNSKEEAQKWLDNYLKEDDLFLKARNEIVNFSNNLSYIFEKFNRHEYVTNNDWVECIKSLDDSLMYGILKEVTKE